MKAAIILAITLATFIAGTFADCHGGGCDEDFKGFGTEPGKCGCCPWPCCCKCVEVAGGDCTTTTDKKCVCVDLAFLVDASGSVSPTVWGLTLQFVQDVLNFTLVFQEEQGCPDEVNMALITFGDNATVHWDLTPGADVVNDIASVPQAKRFTNIVEAMEKAIDEVFDEDSECIPFAVIMTDGRANFRKQEIGSMGAAMRAAVDNNLICIGITTAISKEELDLICPNGYIELNDQSELVQGIIDEIVAAIADAMPDPDPVVCPGVEECFCCCSPEQYWGGSRGRY